MAETKTKTTYNNTGGLSVRRGTAASRKKLLNLDVLTNDSSAYSPYYFNVIRKPLELKLGGNIFEFSPPRNRFKLKSEILFEAIDSQNNPLAYEILPQRDGSSSIRMCIFVYDTNVAGLGIISLVGEAILDECGCPVPEEWEDKPNTRWTTQAAVRTDDVSDIIEYDTAPGITVSETKIPWTYQTYEDVYNINPGAPGSPYTVSGSYTPTYNSEQTNSGSNANDGKFIYTRDIEPDTSSLGQGTIQVYHGNLRFSSSMVGGHLYVSGGANHINGATPNPHPPTANFPAYHATISAVLNSTTAEVIPAYAGFQYEIGNFYPRTFDAKNGARLTWTETSTSVSYTDPTAATTTMTTVGSTVEAHTSYIDLEITNLKPVCGVTTDAEVYIRSTRTQGPLIKLTEFPIEPSNISIDDAQTTEAGNTKEFTETGVFANLISITNNWDKAGSINSADTEIEYNTSVLMDSAKIYSTTPTRYEKPTQFITFQQKTSAMQSLKSNTSYFIEFDAIGDQGHNSTNPKLLAELDVYISGSDIQPTDFNAERTLGQYVGTIKNTAIFQQYIGNSFEYRNEHQTSGKIIFVLRQGTWFIRNIRTQTCPDSPGVTGITPHTSRALIPMPSLTKFNDSYEFEVRYKNKNTVANKISKLGNPIQFEGNDPNAFLASQPGSNTLSPWFHGVSALTSSKHVHISGNLFVSQSIFASEYHTRVVTSSILFQEGDTIFGNTADDTHEFRGNITASQISGVGGNITASGYISASNANLSSLVNATTTNTVFYNDATGELTYGIGGGVGFPYSGSDHPLPTAGTPPQAAITGSLYVSSSAGGGHITASGDISASGHLHFSASQKIAQSTFGVLLYDSGSGQVFMTGSYGGIAAGDTRSDTNTNQLTTWNVGVDTNSNATTIAHGETLTFTGGTGISTETTADGTITFTNTIADTTLTTEAVQDIVGGMVSSNTETNISVTYDDSGGKLNFAATDTNTDTNTQLSDEQVEDIVGGMLGGTETGITVTYQDGTGDIDFVVTTQTDNNFTDSDHDKLDKHADIIIDRPTISGSLGTNADVIRAIDFPVTKPSISGSLGTNADVIRAIDFPVTKAAISGSLGPNATIIRAIDFEITKAAISGSSSATADVPSDAAISGSSGPETKMTINHAWVTAGSSEAPIALGCFDSSTITGLLRVSIDYTLALGSAADESNVPNSHIQTGQLMGFYSTIDDSVTVSTYNRNFFGSGLFPNLSISAAVQSSDICLFLNGQKAMAGVVAAGTAGTFSATLTGV